MVIFKSQRFIESFWFPIVSPKSLALMLFLALFLIGGIYFYLRKVWFYRDPIRTPDEKGRVIASPADGKVIYIRQVKEGKVISKKLGEEIAISELSKITLEDKDGWLVGIYMSPLDVHFNYAPIKGRVEKVFYYQAKVNFPMVDLWEYFKFTFLRKAVDLFDKKFHLANERNTIILKGDDLSVALVEIADKFVNKISCFVKEGEELSLGQKISFIERGSQVDLVIFKRDIELRVKFGDQVYGGKTIIAHY